MKFDAFIFDMDGTLVEYWEEDFNRHFDFRWMKSCGFDDKKAAEIADISGREKRSAALGISVEEYVNTILSKYPPIDLCVRQELVAEKKLILKEGAKELLSSLKQPKSLISQAPKEGVDFTVRAFGIADYFDFIYYRDYGIGYGNELRKPDAKLAFLACEKMNVKPGKNVAVIGDGEKDVMLAKNAGLTSISIGKKDLGAEYSFKNLVELKAELKI